MENRVKPPYAVGVDMSHAGDAAVYAYGGGMGGGKAFRAALNPSITQVWVDEAGSISPESWMQELYREQARDRLRRVPAKISKPIDDWTDAELIMEMLKRGYAAMKLPEDGGKPKVFR